MRHAHILALVSLMTWGLSTGSKEASAQTQPKNTCEGGNATACYNLALDYATGKGVPKDMAKSNALLQKACNGGHTQACHSLGVAYYLGKGITKDTRKAAMYFEKACNSGFGDACYNLAHQHSSGTGVPKDEKKACAFFQKACDAGQPLGCTNLGTKYVRGIGVSRDLAKAKALFEKACKAGDKLGCDNAKAIEKNASRRSAQRSISLKAQRFLKLLDDRANYNTKTVAALKESAKNANAVTSERAAIEYYLGLNAMKEKPLTQEALDRAMSHWKTSVSQFFDPFAAIKLARLLFKGFNEGPAKVAMDRAQSLYYLNLAWEIGGTLTHEVGKNMLWDMVVSNSLGLGDSFHALRVQKKYDWQTDLAQLRPKIVAHRDAFRKAMELRAPSRKKLAFEAHYAPKYK